MSTDVSTDDAAARVGDGSDERTDAARRTSSDHVAAGALPETVAPERPPVRAVNLSTTLRQIARRLPEHTAIVQGDRRITWREFDARVDAVARQLRGRDLGRGDVVLVHSANHVEFMEAMYAIWRVGACFAPTNFRSTPGDIAVLAEITRPSALIVHVDQPEHADAAHRASPARAGTLWIGADPGREGSLAGAPLLEDEEPDEPVLPGDHAWYFFTSGTSGRPKATVLTHDHMGFVVTNHLADLMPGLTEQDGHVVVAPLSHGAGIHLATQVARGAKTVLTESAGLDPAEVWSLVERERTSTMFTVPTILSMLAQAPEARSHDLGSLRYVIYAGAPMSLVDAAQAREVLGEVLVQYYGLGEVTGNITVLPPHLHGRPVPEGTEIGTCGYPRTGMQILLRAPDGSPVAPGESGEICVAGPAVCHGYLRNPEANAQAFRDGWFHTGDLGRFDDEGFLYITGRASDMYISGGSNIHPREVEEKVLQHDAVAEVAVFGVPDQRWGEVGVAVCVLHDGHDIDGESLRAWMQERMARYKVPKRVEVWDELPKSGYGKIVKRTVREELAARDADATAATKESGPGVGE